MEKKFAIFESLIAQITANTGLDDKDISVKVGRNSGYISQLKSRYKNEGKDIPEKFIDLLKLHFATNNTKTQSEKAFQENIQRPSYTKALDDSRGMQSFNEPSQSYFSKKSEDSLHILVESNKSLSEAQVLSARAQVIAEENKRLMLQTNSRIAASNSDLAAALKSFAANSIASELKEIQKAESSKLLVLQELLVKMGIPKLWRSENEGRARLHTLIAEVEPTNT